MFAGDKNIKTLFQIVNSELKLANEWFLVNKLSLNAKKQNKKKQSMYYFIKCQCVILFRCSCQQR